ncbi:diguanylate cyclase [Pararhodospirillum oryzae]|uniref:diguanylate cyclase n=1 Tax=Pararhodospirillum oryzae TaxID=478448 RepID=A0A512HB30_9PROT|nr:diguanylate cyclase [Pararhodospirillum oryzae]GEO82645.1 GGDEF domain-containing protein [Pararhodospirillum oryzae]
MIASAGDIEGRNIRALSSEIKRLRTQLQDLEQRNADLEIALTTAIEHGDAIESEILTTNDRLRAEVHERLIAERRLAQVVEAISQQKQDLEVLLQTITQHSDDIDTQWLRRYAEVEALARLDPLTNIANRRLFDRALETEWARGTRSGLPLGLILCDLDLFKAYNDHYGHQQGDLALVAFAGVLTECSRRPTDLPARLGGEEFVILMPETSVEGVVRVARLIQETLWKRAIPHEGSPHGRVSVSMGATSLIPSEHEDSTALYVRADELLYKAKTAGRNQVCC